MLFILAPLLVGYLYFMIKPAFCLGDVISIQLEINDTLAEMEKVRKLKNDR